MTRFAHLRPHAFASHRDRTRRYFIHHDMPYPIDCAVLGHKVEWVPLRYGAGFHECSRCTLRPHLSDEAKRWTAPADSRGLMERALAEGAVYWKPRRAETHLEISDRYVDHFSVKVKIGNAGSETPLDAHLIVPFWRGFYFGTSAVGNRIAHWRSRRATADGRYKSKVVSLHIGGDAIRWQFGAIEGEGGSKDPKWMHGSWSWKDAICGKREHCLEEGDQVPVVISMPEGDYPALANWERRTWTRKRFAKPIVRESVDFKVEGGIPNGRDKYGDWDSTWGFSVNAGRFHNSDGWETWAPIEAAATMLKARARYATADWTPPADAMNPRMVARA